MEVVLGIPFLALTNTNIQFDTESFTWRSYSAAKVLPIYKRLELFDKHKFDKAALDKISETFIVHIAALEAFKPATYLSRLLI